MNKSVALELRQHVLVASFDRPCETLSWTLNRPGFDVADKVAWIELRNADLPPGCDVDAIIEDRLAASGLAGVPAFVTSRNIARHHLVRAEVEHITATCLTTVGLSNGERVGHRSQDPVIIPGTVNTLVHLSQALQPQALIEVLAIVSSARTAAIMDAGIQRSGVAITGTGTDCILVAAPIGDDKLRFCGMHTAAGEAIGAAVYQATIEGARQWQVDFAALTDAAGTTLATAGA